MSTQNVVIIGSGPAGWTAALYAARATLQPLVFEGSAPNLPGGQLMITSEVENFPGFPEGILGPKLMAQFKEQALRFGAMARTENVVKLDLSVQPFRVTSENGETITTRTVILAMGANAKLLGLPLEKELMAKGAGVSACATCDGAFYRGMDVAVVGGGDTAFEEAQFLTRFANSVTLIHRRDDFRASKIMVQRAQKNPKIRFELNEEVQEIMTENQQVSGVRLKNKSLKIQGLFIAIGHQPNSSLIRGQLALESTGYLKTQAKSSQTAIEGVFACGDLQDPVYRQAITAAGSGCQAAIDCERYLESLGH
ncbi:MAG: thioredoxin-disulfide reductase [Myxococcaceae bacterium]|nr:thioredoxin-disulfide reductase [Myxococcaceae bacterium]MBH2006349.1 thioredoxin-disulfide reductase [Myxococcaceae bacterium]